MDVQLCMMQVGRFLFLLVVLIVVSGQSRPATSPGTVSATAYCVTRLEFVRSHPTAEAERPTLVTTVELFIPSLNLAVDESGRIFEPEKGRYEVTGKGYSEPGVIKIKEVELTVEETGRMKGAYEAVKEAGTVISRSTGSEAKNRFESGR